MGKSKKVSFSEKVNILEFYKNKPTNTITKYDTNLNNLNKRILKKQIKVEKNRKSFINKHFIELGFLCSVAICSAMFITQIFKKKNK